MENETSEQIKHLRKIFEMPVESDEDYQKLGELADEDE